MEVGLGYGDKRFSGGLRCTRVNAVAVGCLLLAAPMVLAQQPASRIGYVFPAGGSQGSTFEVSVGGQRLTGVSAVYVSGKGVDVTVLEHIKPLTPQQFQTARDKFKELREKREASLKRGRGTTRPAWTAEDEKALAEVRKALANPPNRLLSPAIAERVIVGVIIDRDAEPGPREIRLETPVGLTNPLVFCVGQFPEFRKDEPSDDEQPNRPQRRDIQQAVPATETEITLPAVVNGQIMPGGVDRFRFHAIKGQQLVIDVAARALIPYLPDAVPGWFQPTVSLYDAKGKELAYEDDWRFHPDPVLFYRIPADGQYVAEIKDAIYRGREDFVYRITMGRLPFVTSIFPLGGQAGTSVDVELRGSNLPRLNLTQEIPKREPGILEFAINSGRTQSNIIPFAVDTLPEALEQEPNDTISTAQQVSFPTVVNGRIDKSGDWDVYSFSGKAGDEVVAEVLARRLDSPVDSVLELLDELNNRIAFSDDREDKGAGLTTHHADSYLRAKLPAAGRFFVRIGDMQSQGGPEYGYRLRISPPRPDFQLRIAPSSLSARGGGNVPVTVYALRQDGFDGEITLSLDDPPSGLRLSGGKIPAGQEQVKATLKVPAGLGEHPVSLRVEGRAKIDGREVVRRAVPAEDMMQAFAYRHLVPTQQLLVSVLKRWGFRGEVKILSPMPVKIPAGKSGRVQLGASAAALARQLTLELNDPPEGISIARVSPRPQGIEIVLQCAADVEPGVRGNLIVNAFAERPAAGKGGGATRKGRVQIGTLPAIPFEVVAK